MGLSKISAQDVINNLSELNLKLIIKILGEEKEASRIAKNIIKFRSEKKITKVKSEILGSKIVRAVGPRYYQTVVDVKITK